MITLIGITIIVGLVIVVITDLLHITDDLGTKVMKWFWIICWFPCVIIVCIACWLEVPQKRMWFFWLLGFILEAVLLLFIFL